MAYRHHRRERRIRQLEDHWERYYEYQYTKEAIQDNNYYQGNRNPRSRRPVKGRFGKLWFHRQQHCKSLLKFMAID